MGVVLLTLGTREYPKVQVVQRLLAPHRKQLSTWHSRQRPKLMSKLKPVSHFAQISLATQLVQLGVLQVTHEAPAMLTLNPTLQVWQTSLSPEAQAAQLGMLQRRLQVRPKTTKSVLHSLQTLEVALQLMQSVIPQLATQIVAFWRVKLVLQTEQTSGAEQEAQLVMLQSRTQVLLVRVYPVSQPSQVRVVVLVQLIQLATPQSSQLPLTGRKLVTQFSQTLSAEQLTQLVTLQVTQRLPFDDGVKPISQASQTLSVLHCKQLATLQEKQELPVVLRVKF